MTDSANDRTLDERRLANAIDLFRDVSEALTARLSAVKRHEAGNAGLDGVETSVKDVHKALQTVLDYEARLGRRNGTDAGGRAFELDLAGAREEILARLARWNAEGGA